MNPAAQPVQQEDALKYLISALRKDRPHNTGYADYGYDLYLPNVIREYVSTEEHIREDAGDGRNDRRMREISPNFFAAAWELSRRGIIRPGVRILGAQSTQDGGAGAGYSVTPFGRQWLAEADDTFVPTEPERFGQLIAPFKGRLGPGFHQRAQQAIRCYGAHAYLACCAMCGASAESIILAAAIAKEKDKKEILKKYSSANGRRVIENILIGKVRSQVQNDYKSYSTLLK